MNAEGNIQLPKEAQNKPEPFIYQKKPLHIIYFSDPFCSASWVSEPQLRRLYLEYGHAIEIECRMGGLFPSWENYSGSFTSPKEIAEHWNHMGKQYNMPINGDIWLTNPPTSSYLPSIAFKAVQIQDEIKALRFLRLLREQVLVEKINISKWGNILKAANQLQIDIAQFEDDYKNKAANLFEEDLDYSRLLNIQGFPTFIISDNYNRVDAVSGVNKYAYLQRKITTVAPNAQKKDYDTSTGALLSTFSSITAAELALLQNIEIELAENRLEAQEAEGNLTSIATPSGKLWRVID